MRRPSWWRIIARNLRGSMGLFLKNHVNHVCVRKHCGMDANGVTSHHVFIIYRPVCGLEIKGRNRCFANFMTGPLAWHRIAMPQ